MKESFKKINEIKNQLELLKKEEKEFLQDQVKERKRLLNELVEIQADLSDSIKLGQYYPYKEKRYRVTQKWVCLDANEKEQVLVSLLREDRDELLFVSPDELLKDFKDYSAND